MSEKVLPIQFDWKAIWDGVAGLARGVTGVQGEDYFDRSGRYKYWYSVGNRAMPLALQAAGIRGSFNSFSMSRDFQIGYNGTYAQAGTVDAWLGWDSIILSSNPLGNSDKNLQQDRLQATTRESEGPSKAGQSLPTSESKLKHIFREAEGHLPDTPQNRKLLQETVDNPKNYLGKDKYGNDWYATTREDGTQVWVQSRNGEIWDGGLNKQSRTWNDQAGLKNQYPPKE